MNSASVFTSNSHFSAPTCSLLDTKPFFILSRSSLVNSKPSTWCPWSKKVLTILLFPLSLDSFWLNNCCSWTGCLMWYYYCIPSPIVCLALFYWSSTYYYFLNSLRSYISISFINYSISSRFGCPSYFICSANEYSSSSLYYCFYSIDIFSDLFCIQFFYPFLLFMFSFLPLI